MSITSYQIKNGHVAFYNDKGNYVKSIQAKNVKAVNIGPKGNIDIYREDRRESYKNNLNYNNYYR